jgi:hypothetical protein
MLDAIGMAAFAERARRELRATGETLRKRTVETVTTLTTQEAYIARLARDGQTNTEIGAQLFLSARRARRRVDHPDDPDPAPGRAMTRSAQGAQKPSNGGDRRPSVSENDTHVICVTAGQGPFGAGNDKRPQQDSNLRSRLRRPPTPSYELVRLPACTQLLLAPETRSFRVSSGSWTVSPADRRRPLLLSAA